MTDRPYNDEDLRDEAVRQYSNATTDLDFLGVGEHMEGAEIIPGGGVNWGDLGADNFDAAKRSIADLLSNAVDVSKWAVDLGADGLEASPDVLNLDGDEGTFARVHFAFDSQMPDIERQRFLIGLAQVIADSL